MKVDYTWDSCPVSETSIDNLCMKFGVLLEELDEIIKTRILPDEWQDDFYSASDEEVYGKGIYLMSLHELYSKALSTCDISYLYKIDKFEISNPSFKGAKQSKGTGIPKEEVLLRLVESINSKVLDSRALLDKNSQSYLKPEWIVEFAKKEYELIKKECSDDKL